MTREAFHIHILPGMPVTREEAMRPGQFWRAGKWWVSGYLCGNADGGGREISIEELERWQEGCPNCITPWKCNGPHEPRRRK